MYSHFSIILDTVVSTLASTANKASALSSYSCGNIIEKVVIFECGLRQSSHRDKGGSRVEEVATLQFEQRRRRTVCNNNSVFCKE